MRNVSKTHHYFAALAATALALAPPALEADVMSPPGMSVTASNATLPDTRTTIGSGPLAAARDYGANGNGTTDEASALDAGCISATALGLALGLSATHRVAGNLTLGCDLAFAPGASLLVDVAATVTVTGKIEASDTARIFAGAGSVVASTAPYVSVMWWGAGAPGSTDDAPGFRAAMGSNRTVKAPASSYIFNSQVTAPCCAIGPMAVLIDQQDNFVLDFYGAKIVMSDAYAASAIFHIHRSNNWKLAGLECVGNRTGLGSYENACFGLTSAVGFEVRDIYASGNWGGIAAISYGDWLVNGLIENIRGDAVGHCFDYAYLKNVTIRTVRAKGADDNGAQGAGQIGQKCYSNVIDGPNAAQNFTGIAFSETDGVTIDDFDASNFAVGWAISSGRNFTFTASNHWHDNPGLGGTKGIGGYIYYTNGGNFSSVGFPPNRIADRSRYSNNGAAVAGGGVWIDTAAIANGDVISNLDIEGVFDNNANAGVTTVTAASLTNVRVGGHFSGASQTTAIAAALASVPGADLSGYGVTPPLRVPSNTDAMARNAANSAGVPPVKLDGGNSVALASGGAVVYTGGTMRAGGVLTARNYLQMAPTAAGIAPSISCLSGVDTNVGCARRTQGIGDHVFYDGTKALFAILNDRSLYLYGSTSGNTVLSRRRPQAVP